MAKYDNRKPKLLEGEPWFLIRGRDIFAVDAIRAYADLAAKSSSACAEDQERSNNLMKHALQILKIAENIDNWQYTNKDKLREPKPEPKKVKADSGAIMLIIDRLQAAKGGINGSTHSPGSHSSPDGEGLRL